MSVKGRYSTIAVILHWVIAVMILGQIAGGLFMHRLPNSSPIKFDMYQVHKSFGITILLLTIFRLGWRLLNKPPALPETMPGWEKLAARSTHWLFYALLFLTPFAGWAMVSASPLEIPTVYFGVIEWPHLPFFDGAADRVAIEDTLKDRHEFLAFSILGLLALHVGAALKHHFINRDDVLVGMAPLNVAQIAGTIILLAGIFTAGGIYWSAPKNFTPPIGSPSVEAASETMAVIELTRAGLQEIEAIENAGEPTASAVAGEAQPQQVNRASSQWTVDKAASHLAFVGRENSGSFEGAFSSFDAAITFDPENLDAAVINVTVSTASASTGDQLRDANLPGNEWFDVKDHPTATFKSSTLT